MSRKSTRDGNDRIKGKRLLERAGMAMKHEFYLEAVWLLSQLLERKLAKVARRAVIAGEGKQKTTEDASFTQRLRQVKQWRLLPQHGDGQFSPDPLQIDRLRRWINRRNLILKSIMEGPVSAERLAKLADDGVELYREWKRIADAFRQEEDQQPGPGELTG
jgi:hypothetical protein